MKMRLLILEYGEEKQDVSILGKIYRNMI